MNTTKKLHKLAKVLNDLGIDAEYDEFSDNSSQWVNFDVINEEGTVKFTIIIDNEGETAVWKAKREWSDDEVNLIRG